MAAGQQKKRLNAASLSRFNLLEQPLSKKKKLHSPDTAWNLRPHVSLKWDENRKKAVARTEQIGITWGELSSFVKALSTSPSSLADAYSVPEEIFQLKDIKEVLSYEVWNTYLSESERNFLVQFLPRGNDTDNIVRQLLMGENLHFGNPFRNWSASLVSGKLHPDAVLRHSQHIRASKKYYYSGMQIYHNGMIKRLLNWKERWESCQDPESEIVERIWRKRAGHSNHSISAMLPKPASTSLIKEQACDGCKDPGKASRYMSYIKISRRQHQLVKNIKSSGDGIMSKSLTCVLGEVKSLKLMPYEEFEAEESKRLHEHWLQLAYEDLPLVHKEFRKRKTSNEQCRMVIKKEISEKITKYIDKVDNTKLTEKCEFIISRLVYGADDKDTEGNHVGISTAEKIVNSIAIENSGGLTCPTENKESEGNIESLAQQSVHYSNSEVSEGINESLNPDKNSDSVLPKVEDFSSQSSGNLDLHQADNSMPETQLNDELCHVNVLRSPPPLREEHLETIPSLNDHHSGLDSEVFNYMAIRDNSELAKNTSLVQQKPLESYGPPEDGVNSRTRLASNTQDLKSVPSLNGTPDSNSVTCYQETNGEVSANTKMPQDSIFSAKNLWKELKIKDSYSEAQEGSVHPFINNSTLSMTRREGEHPTLAVNMESKMLVEEPLAVENGATLFQLYGNQYEGIRMQPFSKGQNIIMPSFPKEHGSLPSYSYRQLDNVKASGLPAFGQNNCLSQHSIFHPFQEQKVLFEQKQTGGKDLYIQQMAQKADFSNCNSMSHGHNIPVESHDWLDFSSGNGGFPGDHLLSSELRHRNGWQMLEPPVSIAPCLNEGRNADGSLYSILPEYNKISNGLLGNISNSTRVAFPSNFPDVGAFSNSGYGGYVRSQPSGSRSEEAAGSTSPLKVGNVPWVNLPPQNSNVAHFMCKSNTRSWNQ